MKKLLPILIMIFIASCGNKGKYRYTLKDFREPLRSHLQEIITSGVLSYDPFIRDSLSANELEKLSNSEHPILRLAAMAEMLDKKDDDYKVIMSNLDDSAIVTVDEGEFGLIRYKIADYLIEHGEWKNEKEFNETVESVVTKHNNLRSAYYILAKLEPEKKYYILIKEMALRDRPFDEKERALYSLALYQKPEDVIIIKEDLYHHYWEMSKLSFQLMRKFSDTSYMQVLKRYAKYGYQNSRFNQVTPFSEDGAYGDFCKTLAYYNSDTSAAIFQKIIDRFDDFSKWEKEEFGYAIYNAIDKYPAPVYKNILAEVVSKCKIDTISRFGKVIITKGKKINEKPSRYFWLKFTYITIE